MHVDTVGKGLVLQQRETSSKEKNKETSDCGLKMQVVLPRSRCVNIPLKGLLHSSAGPTTAVGFQTLLQLSTRLGRGRSDHSTRPAFRSFWVCFVADLN